jgi:hypothetical protein
MTFRNEHVERKECRLFFTTRPSWRERALLQSARLGVFALSRNEPPMTRSCVFAPVPSSWGHKTQTCHKMQVIAEIILRKIKTNTNKNSGKCFAFPRNSAFASDASRQPFRLSRFHGRHGDDWRLIIGRAGQFACTRTEVVVRNRCGVAGGARIFQSFRPFRPAHGQTLAELRRLSSSVAG